MRWAPGSVKLKPEVLQKQVGRLTEEYGALFVEGTLRDGFIVPQVELVTGIKFLRFLEKENLAPSIPEVLYFFVKRAKSIQKHLDRNRKNKVRISVSSSLRTAFTALSGTTDASSSCLPVGSTFCYGLGWYLWPILKRMRSKRFCAEDRTFLSEGGEGGSSLSGIPSVWHPILFRDTEVFHVRILYIDLPRRFRTFPFGNIGQFAFVNPFRRNGSTFSAVPGRSCA